MHDTVTWRFERVDDDEGEICYEAHGPRDSFVRFEGPNAKADCDLFRRAVAPLDRCAVGQHDWRHLADAKGGYAFSTCLVCSRKEKLNTTVTMARKSNIAGFSMAVHMEETAEERKARALAQLEQNWDHQGLACEAKAANYIGGGLIGSY